MLRVSLKVSSSAWEDHENLSQSIKVVTRNYLIKFHEMFLLSSAWVS